MTVLDIPVLPLGFTLMVKKSGKIQLLLLYLAENIHIEVITILWSVTIRFKSPRTDGYTNRITQKYCTPLMPMVSRGGRPRVSHALAAGLL